MEINTSENLNEDCMTAKMFFSKVIRTIDVYDCCAASGRQMFYRILIYACLQHALIIFVEKIREIFP